MLQSPTSFTLLATPFDPHPDYKMKFTILSIPPTHNSFLTFRHLPPCLPHLPAQNVLVIPPKPHSIFSLSYQVVTSRYKVVTKSQLVLIFLFISYWNSSKPSLFLAKLKKMKDFAIYICICQFFFVTLRPDLPCAYIPMHIYVHIRTKQPALKALKAPTPNNPRSKLNSPQRHNYKTNNTW